MKHGGPLVGETLGGVVQAQARLSWASQGFSPCPLEFPRPRPAPKPALQPSKRAESWWAEATRAVVANRPSLASHPYHLRDLQNLAYSSPSSKAQKPAPYLFVFCRGTRPIMKQYEARLSCRGCWLHGDFLLFCKYFSGDCRELCVLRRRHEPHKRSEPPFVMGPAHYGCMLWVLYDFTTIFVAVMKQIWWLLNEPIFIMVQFCWNVVELL